MSQKKATNLSLPTSIVEEYDALASDFGAKQKWVIASAALLSLIALPEAFRRELIARTVAADVTDGFKKLIESMRNGDLRREFEEKNPPAFEKLISEKPAKRQPRSAGRSEPAKSG